MNCPKCAGKTRTVDSRPFAGTRYRRRLCDCGYAFWTVEELADVRDVRYMQAAERMKTRDKKEVNNG